MGTLRTEPASGRSDLLARPVADALAGWHRAADVAVAPIDPDLADTAAFCEAYEVGLDVSANCVVVAGKRAGEVRYAACMVLATTRADVNNAVRRLLDVRKASFAPMADAVELTGTEYGGITPIGLPASWPVFVDAAVAATPYVIIGSGIRGSKLELPGKALADLPGAQVIEGLGLPADRFRFTCNVAGLRCCGAPGSEVGRALGCGAPGCGAPGCGRPPTGGCRRRGDVAGRYAASRTCRLSRARMAVPPRTRSGLIAWASPIRW